MLRTLRSGQRLVALIGASGSGKSSVVKSRPGPRSRKGSHRGLRRMVDGESGPGCQSLRRTRGRTAACVNQRLRTVSAISSTVPTAGYCALRCGFFRPNRTGSSSSSISSKNSSRWSTMQELRRSFLANLVAAVDDPLHRVTVVLTLRADFYASPLGAPGVRRSTREAGWSTRRR